MALRAICRKEREPPRWDTTTNRGAINIVLKIGTRIANARIQRRQPLMLPSEAIFGIGSGIREYMHRAFPLQIKTQRTI